MKNNKSFIFFLLLAIILIASFFRLYKLTLIPPGIYPDEAMNANDAIKALQTHNFKVFYPDNNGREGLFINLIALSFKVFGISLFSFKITSAIIGILTVLGLYFLAKELFYFYNSNSNSNLSSYIGLTSSFFLAISFWHANFSRISFRAILTPFILVFSFYFLFKGFRNKKIINFIISGILFGLGFYTYISFRFAVILLAITFILWFFIYKKEGEKKQFLKFTILNLIIIFLVALPIGIYFLKNPYDFVGRAAPISVFASEKPIYNFLESFISHLLMFNFYGDKNWRHNFSGSPQLLWPIGILFILGIIFSIKELIFSLKDKNYKVFIPHCFLISWFLIMLLPGALTFEGIPHSLRVIGVIPAVYIFSGLSAFKIFEKIKVFYKTKTQKIFLIFIISIFLFTLVYSEYNKYFNEWAKREEVKDAFSENLVNIGNYLNSLSDEIQKYVIVNEFNIPLYGISIPAQAPIFIESIKFGKPRAIYLKAEELDKIKISQNKTVIIPLYDGKLSSELKKRFPNGKFEQQNKFWVYKINYEQ